MRHSFQIAALAAIVPFIALAAPATAATILIFAETGVHPPSFVSITDHGNGTTSMSTDTTVDITAIAGPLSTTVPITDATYTMSAHSTGPASTAVLLGTTFIFQRFSGTYEISAPECGTDCLSGSFVDLVSGAVGGFALTLSATQPPTSAVTMTSDTIPASDLLFPEAIALSKTALTKPVTFDCSSPLGCTLGSTSANVSGTFSAGVPELGTWAMMLLGFAGLGFAGYRTSRRAIALVD